jgi:cystathionine gamma-lyase
MQNGFSGIVSFYVRGGLEEAKRCLEGCLIFAIAESLGGVESLIDHPGLMTHASVPEAQRAALGIDDRLIRASVGIEDVTDLIYDLSQALGG